jgi:hypothetical protein
METAAAGHCNKVNFDQIFCHGYLFFLLHRDLVTIVIFMTFGFDLTCKLWPRMGHAMNTAWSWFDLIMQCRNYGMILSWPWNDHAMLWPWNSHAMTMKWSCHAIAMKWSCHDHANAMSWPYIPSRFNLRKWDNEKAVGKIKHCNHRVRNTL